MPKGMLRIENGEAVSTSRKDSISNHKKSRSRAREAELERFEERSHSPEASG